MVIPKFELHNASLEIDDVVILEDVTISIQNNCLTRISGENGSGKSCLISLFLNLYTSSTGAQISRFDKKTLCYVPSHPYFFDSERIVSCLRVLGILYHVPFSTVLDVLSRLNLSFADIKYKKYGELSSGMKQKISIIPLFIEALDVFFLDEISQNLDADTLLQISHRINYLLDSGKTVIIIDHDDAFINTLQAHQKEHFLCKNKTVLKL